MNLMEMYIVLILNMLIHFMFGNIVIFLSVMGNMIKWPAGERVA